MYWWWEDTENTELVMIEIHHVTAGFVQFVDESLHTLPPPLVFFISIFTPSRQILHPFLSDIILSCNFLTVWYSDGNMHRAAVQQGRKVSTTERCMEMWAGATDECVCVYVCV